MSVATQKVIIVLYYNRNHSLSYGNRTWHFTPAGHLEMLTKPLTTPAGHLEMVTEPVSTLPGFLEIVTEPVTTPAGHLEMVTEPAFSVKY